MTAAPALSSARASLSPRLTLDKEAKANRILPILRRVATRGIEVSEAERLVRQAMEGDHDPAEVLAELLTVANSCRGEETFRGAELERLARRELLGSAHTLGGEGN